MKNLFNPKPVKQNTQKFKELILYISKAYEKATFSGKTKLNKTLFAIDFNFYEKYANAITGVRYKKSHQGPIPFAMSPVLAEMIKGGEIRFKNEIVGSQSQQRPIPLREPNMRLFDKKEIKLINEWIERLFPYRAITLSKWTHGQPLWELGDSEDFIPYDRAHWNLEQNTKPSEHDKEAMAEINEEYKNIESLSSLC